MNTVRYITMVPCCVLLSGIGVYAWFRKTPMWFRAASDVSETELSDVTAYNHANGIMWGVYSLVFRAALIAGIVSSYAALAFIIVGCVVGIPALVVVYRRIYEKYRAG